MMDELRHEHAADEILTCDVCGVEGPESEFGADRFGNVVCGDCERRAEDGLLDPQSPYFSPEAYADHLMGEGR
jgi:hypothetical protein